MKRFLYLCIVGFLLCFSGCVPVDPVIDSLPEYESKHFYTNGSFQDYTDFGIYRYSQTADTAVINNRYFVQVADNINHLLYYIDNFESWVDTFSHSQDRELSDNYTFDRSVLDSQDWCYLDAEYMDTSNYDLYLYDIQSNTLYYFHNNI